MYSLDHAGQACNNNMGYPYISHIAWIYILIAQTYSPYNLDIAHIHHIAWIYNQLYSHIACIYSFLVWIYHHIYNHFAWIYSQIYSVFRGYIARYVSIKSRKKG